MFGSLNKLCSYASLFHKFSISTLVYTVLIHLIFHQNTHQCADLHTSVLTLYTITSVYVLNLYAGMLILHASVLIAHVGMLNF